MRCCRSPRLTQSRRSKRTRLAATSPPEGADRGARGTDAVTTWIADGTTTGGGEAMAIEIGGGTTEMAATAVTTGAENGTTTGGATAGGTTGTVGTTDTVETTDGTIVIVIGGDDASRCSQRPSLAMCTPEPWSRSCRLGLLLPWTGSSGRQKV